MPKKGFTSFSLKSSVYDYWYRNYQKEKENLRMKGVSSFSGYLTHLIKLGESNQHTDFRFEKIELQNDLLVIRDKKINRIIDLSLKNGKIFCLIDKKSDCQHVGYAYSLPEIYDFLK